MRLEQGLMRATVVVVRGTRQNLGFHHDRRFLPLQRLVFRIGVMIPSVGFDQVLSPSFY
ncbi:unnamed protein product, partial [Brassica rapa subsp. narinosa]